MTQTLTAATKNAAISLRVLTLINSGMNAVDALRTVCGTEATDQMIDALYTELRTKTGR